MNEQDPQGRPELSPEMQELLRLTTLGEEILNRSHQIREAGKARIRQLQRELGLELSQSPETQERHSAQ